MNSNNKNAMDLFFCRNTTLVISITIVILLTSQPFGDIARGIIYAFAAIHSVISFFYGICKKHEKINHSAGAISLIFFFVLTTLLFVIHNDIFSIGLSHLHIFFFALNCLFITPSEQIEKDIFFLAKVFIILGLYKIIGSVLAILIMKYSPETVNLFPSALASVIRNAYSDPKRPNGLTTQPNTLGAIITIACWYSLYLLYYTNNKKWLIISICTIISGLLIIIRVSSRTSLLVTAIFTFIFILLNLCSWKRNTIRNRNLSIIFIIISIVLLLVIVILACTTPFKTYITENIIRFDSLKTASGRTILQKDALEATQNNRLWGVSYIELSRNVLHGNPHTHNIFIQILVTAGIPALFLFGFFFFYSLVCAIKMLFTPETDISTITVCFIVTAHIALLIQSMFEVFLYVNYGAVPFFAYAIIPFTIVLHGNLKNKLLHQ